MDRGRAGPGRPSVAGGAPIRPARPRASPERSGPRPGSRTWPLPEQRPGHSQRSLARWPGRSPWTGTGQCSRSCAVISLEFLDQGLSLGPTATGKNPGRSWRGLDVLDQNLDQRRPLLTRAVGVSEHAAAVPPSVAGHSTVISRNVNGQGLGEKARRFRTDKAERPMNLGEWARVPYERAPR